MYDGFVFIKNIFLNLHLSPKGQLPSLNGHNRIDLFISAEIILLAGGRGGGGINVGAFI